MNDTATVPLSRVGRHARLKWIERAARFLLALAGIAAFALLAAGAVRQVAVWTETCETPADPEQAAAREQQELDRLRETRQRTIDESNESLRRTKQAASDRYDRLTSGSKEGACVESLVHRFVEDERRLQAKRDRALQALDEAIARQVERVDRTRAAAMRAGGAKRANTAPMPGD